MREIRASGYRNRRKYERICVCQLSGNSITFTYFKKAPGDKFMRLFQECTNIFSSDGGKLFAELVKIPFLGKIPIDLRVGDGIGKLQSISSIFPDSPSSATFQNIVDAVIKS